MHSALLQGRAVRNLEGLPRKDDCGSGNSRSIK
jgi:hypothetical protein